MNGLQIENEKITKGLKKKNHKVIRHLYNNNFESVLKLVLQNSGLKEDAEDIFQDALVIVYRKINNNDLKLTCSFKTYLYAICRNLWLQKLQKKVKKSDEGLGNFADEVAEPFECNTSFVEEQKYNMYHKHFLKLSADCQKVLKLFLKKVPLKEITEIMKFSSVDYTKTRKYLCKKSLTEKFLNDPEYQKILN